MHETPLPPAPWDQIASPVVLLEWDSDEWLVQHISSSFRAVFPDLASLPLPARWSEVASRLLPEHQHRARNSLIHIVQSWPPDQTEQPERFIALDKPWLGPEANISGMHVHRVALTPSGTGHCQCLLLMRPWKEHLPEHSAFESEVPWALPPFRSLFQNHPDAIAMFDQAGRFLQANPNMSELSGYSDQELREHGFSRLVVPEDLEAATQGYHQTLEGRVSELEFRIQPKDGTIRLVRVTNIPIQEGGSIVGCYSVARDISQQRQRERQLQETTQKLQDILDSSPDLICSLDESGYINSINKACLRIWGYRPEDLLGHHISDFIAPKDREAALKRFQQVHQEGSLIEVRDNAVDAAGNEVPMIWYARWEAENRQTYCIGKPAGEQDALEKERLLQEQRFRSLVQEGSDLIAILDMVGTYLYVSPTSLSVLGTPPEAYLGKNAFDLVHPEDRDTVFQEFIKLAEQKRITVKPFRFVDSDGNYRWIETIAVNMMDDPAVQGIVANSRDITSYILAQQHLQQSNERFQLVSQATFDAIWDWDLSTGSLFWSDHYQTVFGYQDGCYEPSFRHWESNLHPEDRDRVLQSLEEFLKGDANSWQGQYRYRHKNGRYAVVVDKAIAVRDAGGAVQRMVGAMQDISRQQAAEQQLRENEYRFRTIFEHAPMGISMVRSQTGEILHVNPRFAAILGRGEEELCGSTWMAFTHPDDLVRNWNQNDQLVAGTLPSYQALKRYIRPDGSVVHVDMHIAALETDAEGKVTSHLCMIEDISQRIQEEQHMRLLQSVVTQTTDAVIITQANPLQEPGPQIVYANKAFLDVCGYEESEVIGRSPRFLQGPGTSRETLDKISHALEHCQPIEVDLLNYRKDGSVFWNNISIVPLMDESGSATHFISLQRDITLKKEREELQRAFSSRISRTLQSIQDGFFSIDNHGRMSYWNSVSEHTWQRPAHQVLGMPFSRVFSVTLEGELLKALEEAMTTRQSNQLQWLSPQNDRWYEFRIYSSDLGLTVYFKDVSEQKQAEKRLSDLNEQLIEHSHELALSNAELEQFAYVASHDLQEPLRMVTSFLGLIRKKYDPILDAKGRQYIDFAVDGAARMRQIILDLLEYSRVGRNEDKDEWVSLSTLVQDILTLQRQRIQELQADIQVDPLPTIYGIKAPLRQVFHNLISNALKYQIPGNRPRIHIQASEGEKEWRFAIRDNGIGIEQEYFDRIFILFQRLHSKEAYSGTGIGLAICKKILDSLGGKIWLESEPGAGSTFYFTLPMVQAP